MIEFVYNGSMDKPFKDALGATIARLCSDRKDVIYLDADLMSCIGTADYACQRPDKAINCGISEANMIGVAAGLAAEGFKPIAHTFGTFASRRCFDQVFLSAGYSGNAITVIGSDPGVCATFNGGTHMPFEDMALYRALPGSTVLDITDTAMLASVLEQCQERPGVKYIRVGRKSNARVYAEGSSLPIGHAVVLREGKDALVIACGIMVHEAMQAAAALAAEGIETCVVDCFTVKPLDRETLCRLAGQTGVVVTAENHNRIGGLASAVAEALIGHYSGCFSAVAVNDEFGEVGPQDYLQKRFGLTSENIAAHVRKALGEARTNLRSGGS